MGKDLTEKQALILGHIIAVHESTGFYPTLRELCDNFQWASTQAAFDHVRALERKGYIERRAKRGYRVIQ